MSALKNEAAILAEKAIELATREKAVALSVREWKHRLAGYGYAIRDTKCGRYVMESLPGNKEVCTLPDDLFAA